MSNKYYKSKFWSIEIINSKGDVTVERGDIDYIKYRFGLIVGAFAIARMETFNEVRLVDIRGKVYKSFKQHY